MTLNTSAKGAWLVGDTTRDIDVARTAGCKPVLVKTGKGHRTLINASADELQDVKVVASLADFADYLLNGADI